MFFQLRANPVQNHLPFSTWPDQQLSDFTKLILVRLFELYIFSLGSLCAPKCGPMASACSSAQQVM